MQFILNMKISSPRFVNLFLCLLPFFAVTNSWGQSDKAIQKVITILNQQADDWNNGDIDAFMQAYWQSTDLQFIGSRGVTFGWGQTLKNYKKGYPDKQAMGLLTFDVIKTDKLSRKTIMMSGKFMLDRKDMENLEGHFLLIWKKVKKRWVIIADHTS